MKIVKGKKPKPRRICIYGQDGVGKSTWATNAPGAVVFDVEDGLGDIDCHSVEIRSLGDMMENLSWLIVNKHEYRTLVIDSIDWLERRIFDHVAEENGQTSIADIDYGKGYVLAVKKWERLLKGFDKLRSEKKMSIIFVAHAAVVPFRDPASDTYDQYDLAIHKLIRPVIREWCDEVLFASYRVRHRETDEGFGKKRTIGIGDGDRYLRCRETPSVIAKNRLSLPSELPLVWDEYAKYANGAAKKRPFVDKTEILEEANATK